MVLYIHQNPQKHKFVDDFREWKYSSYGALLIGSQTRLQRAQVLDWFGDPAGFEAMHTDWIKDGESAGFAPDDID